MNDPLAPLRERFRKRAADDLARLRVLMTEDLGADELRRLAHNIAGAAGTFGYPALSAAAMAVDDEYVAGRTPNAEHLGLLEQRLAEAASD
ncbi:Hpt domain-containing protein [Brevundimonas staleyi]|uniref:Hpt domain-containing protein n=1 Tax=Brevundimonas staleyi TaxID=74326 RepID=A0ABW0FT99_9CAUL